MPERLAQALLLVLVMHAGAAHAEIVIASAAPMTGMRAWSGEETRRGVELAVADLNAAGGLLGQPLRLIVGDDAADPAQAVALAQQLVDEGAALVVGHRTSDASMAASAVYAAAPLIQITPASTNPRLTEQGYDNVFRICGRDDNQGRVAGEYLARSHAERRIGLLHDGSLYGRGLAERTRETLRAHGVKEAWYASYPAGQRDFSAQVEHIAEQRIEVLYLGGYSSEAGLIMRQVRERGLDLQLVAGDALHNTDFWMISGPAGQDAMFTFSDDLRDSPAARDVVARLREAGYEPEGWTLHSYAAVQVWAAAVRRAGTLDHRRVAEALRAGPYASVIGTVEFDARGDNLQAGFTWYAWRDGSYRRVP
jgi:branched-chain amino acid transport system substrate-binding protein